MKTNTKNLNCRHFAALLFLWQIQLVPVPRAWKRFARGSSLRTHFAAVSQPCCIEFLAMINFTVRNDLHMDALEKLCLEIHKPNSKSFVIVTWYRPPDSPIGIFSPFESLIGKLDSENVEFFVLGDMRCDMITTRYDNDTSKLRSIADVYGLEQLISEPTRITPTLSSLIDLIYTNCSDKIAFSGVCHIGISDHSMVHVYRKLAVNGMSNGHNSITYRNF